MFLYFLTKASKPRKSFVNQHTPSLSVYVGMVQAGCVYRSAHMEARGQFKGRFLSTMWVAGISGTFTSRVISLTPVVWAKSFCTGKSFSSLSLGLWKYFLSTTFKIVSSQGKFRE